MRKWLALLVCAALVGELYWLYHYVERQKTPMKTVVEIPQDNPIQRNTENETLNTTAETVSSKRLPRGVALIRGLLRDTKGDALPGVVVAAMPAPTEEGTTAYPPKWSAISNDNGEYKIDALPYGTYLISAVNGATHYFQKITLSEEQETAELRGTLLPSYSVLGRVVDELGKDLQGVKVTPLAVKVAERTNPEGRDLSIYRHFPAYSQANGEFTLDYLREHPWRLLLSADGFANTLSDIFEPEKQRLTLVMDQGLNLDFNLSFFDTTEPAGNITIELLEGEFGIERFTASTDNAGVVRFSRLRPANWRVSVLDSIYAMPEVTRVVALTKENGTQTIDATLVKGAKISGSVNRNIRMETLKGIGVIAQSGNGAYTYEVKTDESGAYNFQGLVSGEYQISLSLKDDQTVETVGDNPLKLAEGEEIKGPDFIVSRGYTLQGNVKNAENNPAQGAVVRLENPQDSAFLRETKTDTKGSFIFKGLKDGQLFQIIATLGGMQSDAYGPLILDFRRQGVVNLTLSRPNRGSIGGNVMSAQGRPFVDAVVLCSPEKSLGLAPMQTRTGKFGEFQYNDLVPGKYTLTVGRSPEKMAPQSATTITLQADHSERGLQLLLP